MESIYSSQPLDVESYEIRILTILPGAPSLGVRCQLENTTLLSPPRYVALSYCWGSPEITTNIFVNDVEVPVTVNLAEALQRLRLLEITRVWVDALCINQKDNQEKSHQIRHMTHVYSRADETYVWLGPRATDGSESAMLFLQTISLARVNTVPVDNQHTHSRTIENEASRQCYSEARIRSVINLLGRPYWKRRWIIQEITVSSRIQILCGGARMNLQELDAAFNLCSWSPVWRSQIEESYEFLKRIITIRTNYQHHIGMELCKTVAYTRKSLSTDPRDKLFAMLGICHDGAELLPTPSYKQSVEDVLRVLTKALLRKKKYVEVAIITQLMQDGNSPTPLPSWIPKNFDMDSRETYSGVNKKLALMEEMNEPNDVLQDAHVFKTSGFVVGTILTTSSATGRWENSETTERQSPEQTQPSHPTATRYGYYSYLGGRGPAAAALYSCLATNDVLAYKDTHNLLHRGSSW